jgi:hypothetical protein
MRPKRTKSASHYTPGMHVGFRIKVTVNRCDINFDSLIGLFRALSFLFSRIYREGIYSQHGLYDSAIKARRT